MVSNSTAAPILVPVLVEAAAQKVVAAQPDPYKNNKWHFLSVIDSAISFFREEINGCL